MESLKGTFWWWVELGVEKPYSFKTWEKTNYSETPSRSIGSLKLKFLQPEKKVSGTVLKIKL